MGFVWNWSAFLTEFCSTKIFLENSIYQSKSQLQIERNIIYFYNVKR